MNATQAENLRILIRHMEGITRGLNMFTFFTCGTPACALGEATCVPALRVEGLVDEAACYNEYHGAFQGYGAEGPRFGLSGAETNRLFGRRQTNTWKRNDVTPKEWAAEARKVLTENGYSMDDGFGKFMDKVREPVSLGSYALTPR